VDILVEDGWRRGDGNEPEAEVIVEEIRRVIADPVLNASGQRSIGVISLHADKQARLIQAVGPNSMSDHRSCAAMPPLSRARSGTSFSFHGA
jgi:hypothetical protein